MTNTKELELKLQETEVKGQRAEIAMRELNEVIAELEKEIYAVFQKSDVHDSAGHKTCRMYGRVLQDIQTKFSVAIRKGESARMKLLKIRSPLLRKVI